MTNRFSQHRSEANVESGSSPINNPDESDIYLLFHKNKLLVSTASAGEIFPTASVVSSLFKNRSARASDRLHIGEFDGRACYLAELTTPEPIPEGCALESLRSLFDRLAPPLVALAGRAAQLLNWQKTNRFCGSCAARLNRKQDELAMICPQCASISYPRISPAMIVAVVKDGHLLLARSPRFRRDLFSVLAGFVEIGESLEDCIRREVYEEVGIRIKNISYFGSQSWPFPDSLMVAFTAEYESGSINVDEC